MSKNLQSLAHRRKQQCRIYKCISAAGNEAELAALPAYQRYLSDRDNAVFGGLIPIGGDIKWIEYFKKPSHPPCVFGSDSGGPGINVCFDRFDTMSASVGHLAARGRRRLLYFRTVNGPADMQGLDSALRDHSFDDVKVEQLAVHYENHFQEAVAYDLACDLARRWRGSTPMPDAIIVSDDIAMRGLALALVRERIEVPEKVEVLVWANEGINHHYGIPVTKYEVSPRQFAVKLFEAQCARMEGARLPGVPSMIKGRIVPHSAPSDPKQI